MISDATLRDLFRTESAEHLQRLDELLLKLESAPGQQETLEEAFREAHSMKGAARMLGLAGIQTMAHVLEDKLNEARHGKSVLDSAAISGMLSSVAEIRSQVAVEVGDPVTATIHPAPPPTVPIPSPTAAELPRASAPAEHVASTGSDFRVDSIRVDTRRLDELMTYAAELATTRTRLNRRSSELGELMDEASARGRQADGQVGPAVTEARLVRLHLALAEDARRLDVLGAALQDAVRQIRLVPAGKLFNMFPRMVREMAAEQGKQIELHIEGEDVLVDKRILEETKDPLTHLLRNAVDHGIELPQDRVAAGKQPRGRILLRILAAGDRMRLEVGDDGRGLDLPAIREAVLRKGLVTREQLAAMTDEQVQGLILLPGFTTRTYITETSGRGVGLDVVRANVERLKGVLEITGHSGRGTRFSMTLPSSLTTVRVMIVQLGAHLYGLPTEAVIMGRNLANSDIFNFEGRPHAQVGDQPLPVMPLFELIGVGTTPRTGSEEKRPAIFLRADGRGGGFLVDAVLDEMEVVLKPPCEFLQGAGLVNGAAILDSGEICMVLNPRELLALQLRGPVIRSSATEEKVTPRRKLILLAEDSITTRTQETRILESAGYKVEAVADGMEAFAKLATDRFDALVSDVNMPRLDGLGLAERVRALPQYAELPIILVTSLSSDADRRRGMEVGANAYITKADFDQTLLLDCLERLVG